MPEPAAPERLLLPDLGEGLSEAEIVAWHVGPGDRVSADQPLVSVETEKAVVEIPAPHAGTIARLLAAVGERIAVGAPLLEFAESPGTAPGAVVGSLEEAPQQEHGPTAAPAAGGPPAEAGNRRKRVRASPAVRRLAQAQGIALDDVQPTGLHGEVTEADLLRTAGGASAAPPPAEGWERLHGMRRSMAEAMARAGAQVVPATVTDEAEVAAWPADAPVTRWLVQAMVAGARAAPALNAWFDPDGPRRRLCPSVDLALAVDVADGLLVPVLRDAGALSEAELAAEIARIVDLARRRAAPPALYRAPSITLSNFGSLGGRHAALVVLPPQVAILGAGRIFARDGNRLLPLSLTFDHRAVTGAEAARFLAAAIADLQARGSHKKESE